MELDGTIDKEVYTLVVHLNKAGLETHSSCAGHPGEEPREGFKTQRGFVEFEGELLSEEASKVVEFARGYGLRNIKVRKVDPGNTLITFSPIGQPYSAQELGGGPI